MSESQALVVVDVAAPPTLFGTNDPKAIITAATAQANSLATVVRDKRLASHIEGKEYVRVEGWTLLGTMLGVFPICTWTRPLEDGWEARVEARTLAGQLVGAAEAQCTRDERNWQTRAGYALRSMAQTRATAKALRLPLGFVMSLAGYESTPAEEMDFHRGGAIEGDYRDTTDEGPREPDGFAGITCNFCNSECYDNRRDKRNPQAPDFKCKRNDGSGWIQPDGSVKWLRTATGPAAPANGRRVPAA